ncbi:hypothetical protein HYFRA_00002651 [Hymenoscyphus fraxineus]|uniref:Uncharacterized protein n=1 Tax=Hymenoscyphus fraxineus TaxID=746836 RepID=A0A9N9LAT7_9HELO|nr:hypothetical protein HYFRA_00002651 [Hymenoscyphus fraxineus]
MSVVKVESRLDSLTSIVSTLVALNEGLSLYPNLVVFLGMVDDLKRASAIIRAEPPRPPIRNHSPEGKMVGLVQQTTTSTLLIATSTTTPKKRKLRLLTSSGVKYRPWVRYSYDRSLNFPPATLRIMMVRKVHLKAIEDSIYISHGYLSWMAHFGSMRIAGGLESCRTSAGSWLSAKPDPTDPPPPYLIHTHS